MYESHYLFQFARLWGAKESAKGIDAGHVLLGNNQNPLDALLGDVAGKTGCRYFLIEFKRERDGFSEEVHSASGKPHRAALYAHLREDPICRNLARFGHFGAYADQNGQLFFEPYAHAVAPVQSPAQIADRVLHTDTKVHEMDARSFIAGFDRFYDLVTDSSVEPFAQDSTFFASGLGLPADAFKEYVHCMYQHLNPGTNSKGEAVLVIVDAKTGKARVVMESVDQLVADLHQFFQAMNKSLSIKGPPNSHP